MVIGETKVVWAIHSHFSRAREWSYVSAPGKECYRVMGHVEVNRPLVIKAIQEWRPDEYIWEEVQGDGTQETA